MPECQCTKGYRIQHVETSNVRNARIKPRSLQERCFIEAMSRSGSGFGHILDCAGQGGIFCSAVVETAWCRKSDSLVNAAQNQKRDGRTKHKAHSERYIELDEAHSAGLPRQKAEKADNQSEVIVMVESKGTSAVHSHACVESTSRTVFVISSNQK